MNVKDIRNLFLEEYKNGNFTTDKTGSKTIEILGASFLADEDAIFGVPNQEYINAEIEWYNTKSTSIHTLAEIYGKSPGAWEYSANDKGEINSNYGTLIYADEYHNQFENVVRELVCNRDTRRAAMIYNRPSIWEEYNKDGKNDFICTNAVTYYIRDNQLHAVVQMRSNDSVFGYKNDYAWQRHVMERVVKDYNYCVPDEHITVGNLHWQVQNLHVYERHFKFLDELI